MEAPAVPQESGVSPSTWVRLYPVKQWVISIDCRAVPPSPSHYSFGPMFTASHTLTHTYTQ